MSDAQAKAEAERRQKQLEQLDGEWQEKWSRHNELVRRQSVQENKAERSNELDEQVENSRQDMMRVALLRAGVQQEERKVRKEAIAVRAQQEQPMEDEESMAEAKKEKAAKPGRKKADGPSKYRITCVKRNKEKAVRQVVLEKRIEKFGSEAKLRAGYLCRECRPKPVKAEKPAKAVKAEKPAKAVKAKK